MMRHGFSDPVATLSALAAARLMLRTRDPVLGPLVSATLPDLEPSALSASVAGTGSALFDAMAWLPHPLARIARGCGLSAFDLDLLGLAVLPCLDDRAAATI